MTLSIPGVTDEEITSLITTVIVNFEPRMTRIENTIVGMFSVITFLMLLILLLTSFIATHVYLERKAKQRSSASAAQKYKLYKKVPDEDNDDSADEETEPLNTDKIRYSKRRR